MSKGHWASAVETESDLGRGTTKISGTHQRLKYRNLHRVPSPSATHRELLSQPGDPIYTSSARTLGLRGKARVAKRVCVQN